ncbi:MAG TPA: DUF4124 domain-containing protein [Telluria sp.]|nr:DUF4124 domain-containing protein [Telluria sp.]
MLIVSWLLASGALAQQMYKVVGADGKVTYSDRPQYEKANKLSVMKSYTLRPVEQAAPATPKPAAPAVPVDPNATITADVEEAMVNIMNMNQIAAQHLQMCSASDVQGRAYVAATSNWRKRNAPYIEQQKRLLMEVMSPVKRAELQDRSQAAVTDMTRAVPPTAQGRKEWCDGTIVELDSKRADINKPVMLSIPITKYKAK